MGSFDMVDVEEPPPAPEEDDPEVLREFWLLNWVFLLLGRFICPAPAKLYLRAISDCSAAESTVEEAMVVRRLLASRARLYSISVTPPGVRCVPAVTLRELMITLCERLRRGT